MPRYSVKRRIINELTQIVSIRRHFRRLRCDFDEEDSLEDMIDLHYLKKLKKVSSERYLGGKRKKYRKRSFDWDDCLSNESNNYNNDEFLHEF